jgi:hypothetical protein
MHAPRILPPDQPGQVHRTWRHRDGAPHYFNSNLARQWIESYNESGDSDALARLLAHAEPLARSIIEYRNTVRHESIDELLSRIRIKLWRSLKLYDPVKGTAFSFVAKVISSTSASMVSEAWARSEKFCELDEQVDFALSYDPIASRETVVDLLDRVRRVKTPCTDPYELAAERWLIDSFIDCEFRIRRYQAANSMSEVFGIGYSRSRWLFDTTLVAVRRQLTGDRRLTPIAPASLARTRSEALIRFAGYLSAPEFTKLATLMKDVPPNIILTIDPSRACAIRKGEPEPTRMNLLLVLNGSPSDRRLFC